MLGKSQHSGLFIVCAAKKGNGKLEMGNMETRKQGNLDMQKSANFAGRARRAGRRSSLSGAARPAVMRIVSSPGFGAGNETMMRRAKPAASAKMKLAIMVRTI